jgi:hypothetical protein
MAQLRFVQKAVAVRIEKVKKRIEEVTPDGMRRPVAVPQMEPKQIGAIAVEEHEVLHIG